MHKIVISNTSPIFYLYRLGYLELMEQLYGEIVIPNGVVEELNEGGKTGEDVPDIKRYKWIKVRHSSVITQSFTLKEKLHFHTGLAGHARQVQRTLRM